MPAKKKASKKKVQKKLKKKMDEGNLARKEGRYNEWVDQKFPGYAPPSEPLNPFK